MTTVELAVLLEPRCWASFHYGNKQAAGAAQWFESIDRSNIPGIKYKRHVFSVYYVDGSVPSAFSPSMFYV